ncbi:MAG: PD40 domain-containing protein [Anaerolineales bacterium]|nr:PD40 domain-containing protein [Anaerolineales bacterium]
MTDLRSGRILWLGLVGSMFGVALAFLFFIVLPGFQRLNTTVPVVTSSPDLLSTLQAVTPDQADSATPVPVSQTASAASPGYADGLTGRIAFTCQVNKVQASDQICIMNADGSGYRRLTTDNGRRHFYPSIAPDGQSVVFSAFRDENIYEIYEVSLDGVLTKVTDGLGVLTAPEISPDGSLIAFTRWMQTSDTHAVWVVDRDGENPREVTSLGWDPTWSPDGSQILFMSNRGGTPQLYVVGLDGSGLRQVADLPDLRGRSDWSQLGQIVTYSGKPWQRELFLMAIDGSGVHQITPAGGNSQGPSFSPNGQWVAFTSYYDHKGDIHGCEIYIMRINGTDLRRLTDNEYCDWQPRWGP